VVLGSSLVVVVVVLLVVVLVVLGSRSWRAPKTEAFPSQAERCPLTAMILLKPALPHSEQ
jgi:hypothetical protein